MNFERPPRRHGAIEIAPLVDVVFLLLLFFVLTYNTANESAFEVVLPVSSEADQPVYEDIRVTIRADGAVFLNDIAYPLPELSDALRDLRLTGERPLVSIHADERLEIRSLISVVDAVKQAGCPSFRMVTRNIE